MDFEWDESKAEANKVKHGVDFADAIRVFRDEAAITEFDEHPEEDRYVTMGMDVYGRILVVVYTVRDSKIRIISARRATRSERRYYDEGL